MKGGKRRRGVWLAPWIFFALIGMMGFPQENEPSAERTSLIIQRGKKDIYKAGIQALPVLKYKIQKKKKTVSYGRRTRNC